MKVIITGPTGAIGMALIKKYLEANAQITAICHKGSARIKQIPICENVKVIEADLSDLKNLCKADIGLKKEEKADIFYHFAWAGTTGQARNNMPLQIENIQYTIDAVQLASRLGCHTFIGAGSQAEYGRVEGMLTADTPVFPENGYGMAKLCAGQMSRQQCETLGIRHVWTRILSVYGPYDGAGAMVTSTITKLLRGERAGFTPGEQMWDYLYSEDAAQAMYLLGQRGQHGKTYVLGSGQVRRLKEYILQIEEAVKECCENVGTLGFGDMPYCEKQVMYLGADITQLREDTGYEPMISFEDGIRRTVKVCMEEVESNYGRN